MTNTTAISSARMPRDEKNLADLYKLDPIPWSRALEALESNEPQKQTPFLTTMRPDGRPHVAGVGALWDNGKVYVVSGPGTRKSRNLSKNPSCIIAFSLTGIDLVIEGKAARVTDDATLQHMAKRYADQGLAGDGQGRRVHPRVQRAERRAAAVVRVRDHPDDGLRRHERRAGRRHSLAVLTPRPPGARQPGAPVAATTARVRRSVSMASA